MITVHVRKQGGAAIMTIPSDVLKMLNLEIGATLALDVTNKGFTAQPVRQKLKKRYTLAELLHGTNKQQMKNIKKKTAWFRDAKSIGRETP